MNETSVCTMGTTSACAENTTITGLIGENRWNYLRVRGEYKAGGTREQWREGTTSACAENTWAFAPGQNSSWNYLRVRGEYPK